MKARPILFSTPMVQAILKGRKTQTRRVVKPQPGDHPDDDGHVLYRCPYGQVGDVLYVKETFFNDAVFGSPKYVYRADGEFDQVFSSYKNDKSLRDKCKWKSPRFMPKSSARIFLKITDLRVERLQQISKVEAIAEGIEKVNSGVFGEVWRNYGYIEADAPYYFNPTHSFESLWQSINGEQSWTDNPYVWVIEFTRIDKPENF
jgi:hypothetical protein